MAKYIDIDKFRANHHMRDDCDKCDQSVWHCQNEYFYSRANFCQWLDGAEIEDVVKVNHGKWIVRFENGMVGYLMTCSVCDANIQMPYKYYAYCPNCGTRMDEDKYQCF